MKIEVFSLRRIKAADVAAWRALQSASTELQNPFLTPEFALAVAAVRPRAEVARLSDGDQAVGFLPFERGRAGVGRPVGAGLSDYQGMVCAPGLRWSPTELLRACRLSVIEFDHLVTGQDPLDAYLRRRDASPIIDLAGGYDAYVERRRSRSLRRLVARRDALFAELGEVRFEFHTAAEPAFDALFEWKSAQYRRTGRADRFARPWIRTLVRELMATETEHFRGVLSALWVGERPIAVQAGLASHASLSLWFPAYDPEFASYSPGNVLRLELIRAAAERGFRHIDMGKGFSVHKEQLKTGERLVGEALVARRSPQALLHGALREPPRRVERFVLDHPRVRVAARHTLARLGQARVVADGRR